MLTMSDRSLLHRADSLYDHPLRPLEDDNFQMRSHSSSMNENRLNSYLSEVDMIEVTGNNSNIHEVQSMHNYPMNNSMIIDPVS